MNNLVMVKTTTRDTAFVLEYIHAEMKGFIFSSGDQKGTRVYSDEYIQEFMYDILRSIFDRELGDGRDFNAFVIKKTQELDKFVNIDDALASLASLVRIAKDYYIALDDDKFIYYMENRYKKYLIKLRELYSKFRYGTTSTSTIAMAYTEAFLAATVGDRFVRMVHQIFTGKWYIDNDSMVSYYAMLGTLTYMIEEVTVLPVSIIYVVSSIMYHTKINKMTEFVPGNSLKYINTMFFKVYVN